MDDSKSNGNEPGLLILAAGLGSRFGGYKQTVGFGPDNETIMELSINSAIEAGFSEIGLVINRDIRDQIDRTIISKYRDRIPVSHVYQDIDCLPDGFACPKGRTKPWGTAHAILVAKSMLNKPFAVINADDFYGTTPFSIMFQSLTESSSRKNTFHMIGYKLGNTLSKHGGVSRGWCSVDSKGQLLEINETKSIMESRGKITGNLNGKEVQLSQDAIVSMNFWGFTPFVFELLEQQFNHFLNQHGNDLTSEFFITDVIDSAIKGNEATIEVHETSDRWFGVTYQEDKKEVERGIAAVIGADK